MLPIVRLRSQVCWTAVALFAVGFGGCQSINLPTANLFSLDEPPPNYVGLEPGFESNVSLSQEIYHKVREAEAQNGIVLQVVGDDEPLRVLPLPPEQKSVFVSDLLKQTGVQQKLGRIDAVLFRPAAGTIGGIRMEVQMSIDKRSVRPESDYALRAGDRLRVEKATNPGLEKMIKMAVGL